MAQAQELTSLHLLLLSLGADVGADIDRGQQSLNRLCFPCWPPLGTACICCVLYRPLAGLTIVKNWKWKGEMDWTRFFPRCVSRKLSSVTLAPCQCCYGCGDFYCQILPKWMISNEGRSAADVPAGVQTSYSRRVGHTSKDRTQAWHARV